MAGHDLKREDELIPELAAWQELAAASVVFMRGLRTYTNTRASAYERLARALDAVAPGWRDDPLA